MEQKDIDRFWSRVDRSAGPDACWPWKGKLDRGYGRFKYQNKALMSYRVALELFLGRPLALGKMACHRCNNRACCNPAHIYEGTAWDNVQDSIRAGTQSNVSKYARYVRGMDVASARLTESDVLEIYRCVHSGESLRRLSRRFGVARRTVVRIRDGDTWAWLTGYNKAA